MGVAALSVLCLLGLPPLVRGFACLDINNKKPWSYGDSEDEKSMQKRCDAETDTPIQCLVIITKNPWSIVAKSEVAQDDSTKKCSFASTGFPMNYKCRESGCGADVDKIFDECNVPHAHCGGKKIVGNGKQENTFFLCEVKFERSGDKWIKKASGNHRESANKSTNCVDATKDGVVVLCHGKDCDTQLEWENSGVDGLCRWTESFGAKDVTTVPADEPSSTEDASSSSSTFWIILGVVIVLLVFIFLFIIPLVCYCRKDKKRKDSGSLKSKRTAVGVKGATLDPTQDQSEGASEEEEGEPYGPFHPYATGNQEDLPTDSSRSPPDVDLRDWDAATQIMVRHQQMVMKRRSKCRRPPPDPVANIGPDGKMVIPPGYTGPKPKGMKKGDPDPPQDNVKGPVNEPGTPGLLP